MISFIVIGRNEGKYLSKCFDSIIKTIEQNNLSTTEIIYVDSKSDDNSIAIAKNFKQIKIFQLTADYNAAIARNLGAEKSNGEILFFIDGDMEIVPEFLSLVYNVYSGLNYKFISGQYVNYFYNKKNELISKENYDRTVENCDQYKVITGGIFLIERKYWDLVNGMKNKYKRSQDLDFGLRLAKMDIKLLRKKEVISYHHTISYRDKNRMWKMLLNKAVLFANSMLLRDHFFNSHFYQLFFRSNYSLVVLVLTVLLIVYHLSIYPILFYFMLLLLRSYFATKKNIKRLFAFFTYYLFRDVIVLCGIFIFFPKNKFNIQYNEE
jgi:glycosyltransferase involved in cell wall biosynthesis